MTKKELAAICGLSAAIVSYYEKDERRPSVDALKRIAAALGVRVADFLVVRDERLKFVHGEFRKTCRLQKTRRDFIREAVEDYFGRFFNVVEILGGEVLPPAPTSRTLESSGNFETDATNLRRRLNFTVEGPIANLISSLENKGLLLLELETDDSFSGTSGFVGNYPYIVVNKNHTPERKRSTIACELARWAFKPSPLFDEKYATAVAGAFFLSRDDIRRELGLERTSLGTDAVFVCREYGVSIGLLAIRARQTGILNESNYRSFRARIDTKCKNKAICADSERPALFEQLVCRAVDEGEIGLSKAAELLRISRAQAAKLCLFDRESR